MKKRLKIMTIFGTHPEAIKMAPLVLELHKRSNEFTSLVTVTAQHRAMLDQVLVIFHVETDFDLNIMKQVQTLTDISARTLDGLDTIIKDTNKDMVLVHDDNTTT